PRPGTPRCGASASIRSATAVSPTFGPSSLNVRSTGPEQHPRASLIAPSSQGRIGCAPSRTPEGGSALRVRFFAVAGSCCALMLGLAACGGGGGGGGGGEVSGTTLTVYSSLPLQGASRPQSVAVNQGATLALQQQG